MASALIGGAGGAIRFSLLQARVGCTVSTSNATCSASSTVTTTCVSSTSCSTTTACCARGGGRSSSSMTGRSNGNGGGGLPASPPAAATSVASTAGNNSGVSPSPPRFWHCAPPPPILLASSGGKAAGSAQTAGRSVSVAALSTVGRCSEDRQVQVFVTPPPPQSKGGQGTVHGCLWNTPEFLAAALLSVAAGAAGAMVSGASHRGEAGGTFGPSGQRAAVSLSVKHAGGTHRLFDGGGGGDVGIAGGGGGGGSGGGGRTPWSSNGPMKDGYEATHSTVSTMHTASSRPYEVSVRAVRGGRLYMEDEYFITEGGRFAAVFDGHGGSGVSRYLRENLYDRMRYYLCDGEDEEGADDREAGRRALAALFQSSLSESGASSSSREFPTMAERVAALRSAFREVDREVLADDNLEHQGSTAVAVVLHESRDGCRSIISANIGDSRAVLSRRGRAVDLTRDHKPNDEKEKARIMSLGEEVEWDGYSGVYRVQNLSLSRAIGDRFAKPAVSGEVEIKRFPVTDDGDEFVILASDGLWDVMESQDAVNFVHKKLGSPIPLDDSKMLTEKTRRRHMSRYLANEALRRGSGDNICVVVVWLKRKKPSSKETS